MAQAEFKSVAAHQLLSHLKLGGDRWIGRFTFGFLTTRILSKEGVFPYADNRSIPAPISAFWSASSARFRRRPRASGFRNAEALWSEAIDQVVLGRLVEPSGFSDSWVITLFSVGNTNVAFRFGVSQGEKLRSCDDLRRCLVNACTVVLTPIAPPT